jgi:hypothetical protein
MSASVQTPQAAERREISGFFPKRQPDERLTGHQTSAGAPSEADSGPEEPALVSGVGGSGQQQRVLLAPAPPQGLLVGVPAAADQ